MQDYIEALEQTVVEMTAAGGDFEVVEQVINGVNRKIYSKAPPTLREYLQLMNNHADAIFMVYQEENYTFAQAYEQSAQLANALVSDYGVKAGDRVAIAMRNNPQWVMAFTAIVSIGAVAVPMNGWWTTDELRYGFSDSGAKLTICDSLRCERIRPFAQELDVSMIVVGDVAELTANESSFNATINNASTEMPELEVSPEDLATIMYTSGSTGNPKGVMATHRSIVSALFSWVNSAYAAIGADIKTGVNREQPAGQAGILLTIPLFHVTACHTIFLLSVLAGRKMAIMYKWDVEEALRLIEHEKLTNFSGVPTMSAELAQAAATTTRDISTLREIQAGGAPRPPEQVKKLNNTFANASAGLGYGLTETNGIGTVIAGPLYSLNPASCGRAVPALTELKVIDENGKTLGVDEPGEVCIHSICLANGYWNNPSATEEVFVDGWFHTGDIGKIDEYGFLVILDRIKDIIIRGGENISCIEVEAALYEHADVEEAAVFGLPDEALGEAVGAVIVSQNTNLTTEQLQQFVAERLAGFKIPAHIWIVTEKLPRIATGKIYKKGLKADYAKLIAA